MRSIPADSFSVGWVAESVLNSLGQADKRGRALHQLALPLCKGERRDRRTSLRNKLLHRGQV